MENTNDVYDLFSSQLDFFIGRAYKKFLTPMFEMLRDKKCEMYVMPALQRRIIGVLTQYTPGSPISIKELAVFCRTHQTNIPQELYTLEEKGYVEIKTSKQDRRVKLVQITPEGKAMHDECNQQSIQILREYFRLFCTDEQMEEIVSCLCKLNDFCDMLEPERYF